MEFWTCELQLDEEISNLESLSGVAEMSVPLPRNVTPDSIRVVLGHVGLTRL